MTRVFLFSANVILSGAKNLKSLREVNVERGKDFRPFATLRVTWGRPKGDD